MSDIAELCPHGTPRRNPAPRNPAPTRNPALHTQGNVGSSCISHLSFADFRAGTMRIASSSVSAFKLASYHLPTRPDGRDLGQQVLNGFAPFSICFCVPRFPAENQWFLLTPLSRMTHTSNRVPLLCFEHVSEGISSVEVASSDRAKKRIPTNCASLRRRAQNTANGPDC